MLLRIIFRNYRVIEIKVIDNKINKIYKINKVNKINKIIKRNKIY
jgi:hypothetical protein